MTKKRTSPPVVKLAMEHYGYGNQERQPAESIICPHCSHEVCWKEGCWHGAGYKNMETGEWVRDAYNATCKNCMKSFIVEMHYVEPVPSFAIEVKPFLDQPVLKVIRQAIYMADRLCAPVTFENAGYTFFLMGHESAEDVYINYLQKRDQDKIVDGKLRLVMYDAEETSEPALKD